jgi:hypothetical protein
MEDVTSLHREIAAWVEIEIKNSVSEEGDKGSAKKYVKSMKA